jgi:hypothetical protein
MYQIGSKVRDILKHIMFWVHMELKYPAAASILLRTFTWHQIIASEVFEKSTLVHGNTRPFDDKDDLIEYARAFITKIYHLVNNDPLWQSPKQRHAAPPARCPAPGPPDEGFIWNSSAHYWSPEKETAEDYREYMAGRCPTADTCIIHVQIPFI